jgi:hypothetical protein
LHIQILISNPTVCASRKTGRAATDDVIFAPVNIASAARIIF